MNSGRAPKDENVSILNPFYEVMADKIEHQVRKGLFAILKI